MSLSLDPATTALVLIDLQKGVVGMDTAPRPAAEVVGNGARLADAFRAAGAAVVLVHVGGDPAAMLSPEADERMATRGGERPPDWSEIVPEVGPRDGDLVVMKRQWGAFYGTDLDLLLRRRGVRTLVMGGIATNYGVESTARDAYERGYEQVFAEDAMASMTAELHELAIRAALRRIGRVRSTDEILAAL